MTELANEYGMMFGEIPPILFMLNYDHPLYEALIKKAIMRGSPITEEEIDQLYEQAAVDIRE